MSRGKVIITNAFTQKGQKLGKQDKDTAVFARLECKRRVQEGCYYEYVYI